MKNSLKTFKHYTNIPSSIDKDKDGNFLYPEYDDYQKALRQYAIDNKIDPDKFVSDINDRDNKRFKKQLKQVRRKTK